MWSDTSNDDSSHAFPNGAALTSEETLTISNQMTSVISYAFEEVLKFITGASPINDSTWQTFVDNCYAQGLTDCLDVYNNAYQEFLAGERTAVVSSGPGAPPPDGGGAPPDGPPPEGPPPA